MSYIFPNKDIIKLVKESGPHNGILLNKNSDLHKSIFKELDFSYHKSIIKLSQCSRNLVADTNGPNVLFLSETDGGYAKQGLTIINDDNKQHYSKLNYVDLMLNEESVADGKLSIFSHEMAHVMMNNILPNVKVGKSSMQHLSVAVTDFNTAFIEGFAIQFERFTNNFTPHYANLFNNTNKFNNQIIQLWQSNTDSINRVNGVVDNRFINKKINIDSLIISDNATDYLILEHTYPTFNKLKLKNAQQMLACEGVVATLFYRINSNKRLQNNYQDRGFYKNFLIRDLPNEVRIKDIFTPFENVILKNLWVMHNMSNNISDENLMINFINTWVKIFPEDKGEIINIFITTTIGKTITNELSKIYEQIAYAGMFGDIEKTIVKIKEYRKMLQELCQQVLDDKVTLNKNLGKEIWINSTLKVPTCFWQDETQNLNVNINTATANMLRLALNISSERALTIVSQRDKKGFFASLKEFESLLK